MEIKDENVVDTTATENVDTQSTEKNEENVKENKDTFTEEQQAKMNKIIQDRVLRAKKTEEKKYSKLVNVLKAGLGTDDIDELTEKATNFYKDQGVEIPTQILYDEEDEEVLAKNDANKIIDLGYDEIVNETNEMMKRGQENLSTREKMIYRNLANARKEIEDEKSLESIGVDKNIIQSKKFQDFTKKFKDTPVSEIYEIYSKVNPDSEKTTPIGSVKSTAKDDGIKDYYSPEDFDKLTKKDLDNPKIWERVMQSRTKWK